MNFTFLKRYSLTRLKKLEDVALLLIRLVLAYGFFEPALLKWKNIGGTVQWFESMHYPLPRLSVYLSGSTEVLGIVLLVLGLGTRIISIPLMIVMLVAIFTVHISNGFAAGDNGFEIPLYYLLMLFILLVQGGGKISLDYLLTGRF